MGEVAASNVLHPQWAKDQSQSHLFIKYSKNRKENKHTVLFLQNTRTLLNVHCKLSLSRELVSIHTRFDKLMTSLRTAVDNEWRLDKQATSHNDLFDAFLLAMKFYHFEQQ